MDGLMYLSDRVVFLREYTSRVGRNSEGGDVLCMLAVTELAAEQSH